MKRLLLITTALVTLFGYTQAFADEDLVVSSGTHNKNNMSNNYNSIIISGGTVDLSDFNIYSVTDAAISGGSVIINRGGINARNGSLDISGGNINSTNGSIDGGITNISNNAKIVLDGDSDLTAKTEMNILGGTITAQNESNVGVDGRYLNISGGTINLINSAIYATPENHTDKPSIYIRGGTINLKGEGYIVSNTMEDFGSYERYTAGEGHITGGTINVTTGKNALVMDTPDLSGTINIAQGSTLGIWQNYDDDDETIEFFNKGTLIITKDGIVNLNGGKLEANVAGEGTINVNRANSVIDGDFSGSDLNIYANTTISKFITGDINSLGNLHLYKGVLDFDKIPDDESTMFTSFTMDNGTTLKGEGLAVSGAVNINGGTINVSDGVYLESSTNKYSDDAGDLNISGGTITVSGIRDEEDGDEAGEITLVGNGNLNISGANTVINMNFADIEDRYNYGHDGGILHEGKSGDINISGGTINLRGKYAKIERGGYDGDWIYDNDGNALMTEDEFHDITGKWLTEESVTDDDIRAAGLDPYTIDRGQYHVSQGDINITGGTINLNDEDARISTTYKNTGNINISNARVVGDGYISIKGAGNINIDEGSYVDVEDITAGGTVNVRGGTVNLAHKHGGIYSYYHENSDNSNVNISGGTVNLSNRAGIYANSSNNPSINITGGKITSSLPQNANLEDDDIWPAGRIQIYGDGNINIKGNAVLEMQAGDIQKGHHRDGSERAKGDVNISENANITLYDDSHINSDQDVNISGGTINLYNNGTIDAYGDINITGGNITIGKADVAPVSLEEDGSVWSAVSSHYKDGNVYMSGGELTLYNNAALGRSANIDEDMDIEQFGDEITGNIEISGGTVNANGNSLIWLGGADGEGEAGEAMAQKIASGEIVEKGDIIISGANTEVTLNDDASIALAAHGKIDIKDNAKVYMNGNSKIANMLNVERDYDGIGNVNINSGSVLTVNGNNDIEANYEVYVNDASLVVNEGATLNVESLKVKPAAETKPMSSKAIYAANSDIDLYGTLNADILDKNSSRLTFSGTKAKLNGDALDLETIAFTGSNTSFKNQTLTADNISLNSTTLDFNGDVVLRSLVENIELSNDSLININSGENTIESAQDIVFNNSNMLIKDGATLTLNVGEGNYARFNDGHIYVQGTLLGNVIADSLDISGDGIINGGMYKNTKISGESGNMSSFITGGVDVGNLNITSGSNIILNRANILQVNDDERRYSYVNHGYYTEITDENDFDEDEDGDIRNYENQIRGTLSLNNSTLKLNTNLAAKRFVIDNHSTLNAQDKIIGGKSLLVDNYSTANLQHTNSRLWNESGFSDSVVVDHNSVLNITSLDIGNNHQHSDYVHVLNGSALNMTDDGFGVGQLLVDNSTISAKNADFTVKFNDGNPSAVFNKATIDLDNGFAYTHGITKLEDSTATIKNRSALTANQTIIENSTITADNSHVGAFKHAIDIDVEDETIYNDILHGLYLDVTPTTDLTVSDSEITLNGNSELGVAMAIMEWDDTSNIIGYLTPEMLKDETLLKALNSKYKNYEMQRFDDDSYQNADQYKAQINIVGSNIVLNDNAKIINAMLNADEGKISDASGGISINGGSTITVNGNNTLSASDEIDIYNSNVIINKGATLNVESSKLVPNNDIKPISYREINLSNTTVDLRGTLNGDISAKNNAVLNIYDDAVLNGNASILNKIIFNESNSKLKNQSLSANEIILDKSIVDITGGVYLSAFDSLKLADGSIMNVAGTNNDIYAQNSIELNDSVINIKKNAQLNFNVGEGGAVELDNSFINIYEGSNLSGNVKDLAQLTIISGPAVQEDQFVATDAAKISAMVNGKITNLGDLVIMNHKNLNIDKDGIFVLSADDEEYSRLYESGNYNRKKYYADESNIDDDDEDDDAGPKFNYENQIIGKLQIKNSNVTSSSNFAADEIVVDNSTLNVTDRILGAKTLNVTNGSKVSLLGKNVYTLSGFDERVNVSNGSTLTTNYLQIGDENSEKEETAELNISGGSTYNVSNGEVYTGVLNAVDNSTVNATNVRLKVKGSAMNFDASKLNASGSFVQSDGNLFITKNADDASDINLKANSTLTAEKNTGIYGSTIVADNSNIGVFKHAIKIEVEDREVKNRLHYYSPYDYDHHAELNMVLDVDDSEIKLSGNSRLGAGLAIVNWKSSTQGVIEGLITADLYENPSTFLKDKRFNGYDFENFEDGFDAALNYEAFVTIDNSKIVMDGTSAIINAALNTQEDNMSGDIQVYNSAIEVKGNNATISAAKDIKLTNSSLTILRGGVLNIISDTAEEQFGKDITLDGTSLDLGGVIKGNVSFADSGDVASQFILNGGRVEGTVSGLNTVAFGVGQNGNTSATLKGMKFTDIQDLVIAGTIVNGKTTAPKITLDSDLFELSDEDARRYYGYYKYDKEYYDYSDGVSKEQESQYVDIMAYNQISGDVNIENGAILTLNKAMAAKNFNVDNATLISNNALMYGNLNLDNKANVTINGNKMDMVMKDVELAANSTLNLNSVEYIEMDSLVTDNANFNTNKWTEMGVGNLLLTNSKTNIGAGGAWILANNANVTGGLLNIADADVKFRNTSITDADVTASKRTLFAIDNAVISGGKMTVNDNSKIITDSLGNIYQWHDYGTNYDMKFINNATVNLNGSGGIDLAIVKLQYADEGRDKDLGYLDADLRGNVVFDSATINMADTAHISNKAIASDDDQNGSGNVIFANNSVLNIKGKNNVISANNRVEMLNSALNIAKGATLSIISEAVEAESDNTLHVAGSEINLAGVLKANLKIEDDDVEILHDSKFILNGGRVEGTVSGLNTVAFGSGQNGNTSATLKGMKFADIKNLSIAGSIVNGKTTAPKIILDSAMFAISDEENQKYYAYDKKAKGYKNLGTWENVAKYYANNDQYEIHAFDNQIKGNVEIKDGASLTVNSALAADTFELDNKAILVANNARIDGNLSLDNNSTATISGKTSDVSMGVIELKNNSTLNLNAIDWMGVRSLSANNSKLNISNKADLDPFAGVSLKDTITTISSACMWEDDDATERTLDISGGTLNAVASEIGFFNTAISGANITASKGTIWAIGAADISDGTIITLNDNSKMLTGGYDDQDYENKEAYFQEFAERYESKTLDMNFSDSTVNLNGTSAIETAIMYNDNIALNANIKFDNSEVNMNGTSSIKNTAKVGEDYEEMISGNIAFENGSILNVKGKNNTLAANGMVRIVNSGLNLAKGATLSINTYADNENAEHSLYVSGSEISLGGVLKSNLYINDADDETKSALILNGGRIEGEVVGLKELALGSGQNGKTSSTLKGTMFGDIEGLTIAGTIAANGKVSAPNVILDSAVFTVSEAARAYAYDKYEKENIDEANWWMLDEYDDEYLENNCQEKVYENQILGDVNVSNKAALTVNKSLAAENINIDNATLVSNNGLLYGHLNLNDGAVATINGSMLKMDLPDITMYDNSTLNLNAVEYLSMENMMLENSKLNTSKYAEILIRDTLEAVDSSINIKSGGTWLQASQSYLSGGSFSVEDADIRFDNTQIYSNKLTLSKNTIFGINNAYIANATINVNDKSRLVTDFEYSNKYEPDEIYSDIDANMTFENSLVNLNASSSIEQNVIFEDGDTSGRGKILPKEVIGLKGNVVFNNTVVNMNGTSAIKNLADAEVNSGDINFNDGSKLNVRGKNVIEAIGNINIDNSTLDVAKGAVLNNIGGGEIVFSNARLKWIGTINSDLSGSVRSLILGATAPSDKYNVNLSGITSFGISGISSKKDIAKAYNTYLNMGGAETLDTFEVTDKANLTLDDSIDIIFDNLNVENATLTLAAGERNIGKMEVSDGSTVKVAAGAKVYADSISINDSSLTVSGKARGRNEKEYSDELRAFGIYINNENNTKAGVNVSNTNIDEMSVLMTANTTFNNVKSQGLSISNYGVKNARATMNNVEFLGNLNINDTTTATLNNINSEAGIRFYASDIAKDKKGNNIYNTATLTGISAEVLEIENTKAIMQKNNTFNEINVAGEGYLDIRSNMNADVNLANTAIAALAAKQQLNGDVSLDENTVFNLQGKINGEVKGNGGTLNVANSAALISGDVSNVDITFSNVKNKLSSLFAGNVANIGRTELKNSTLTADKNDFAYGDLALERSTLVLADNGIVQVSGLSSNASTLNLGTGKLIVNGDALLANKSNISLKVEDAETYGQLLVDGNLMLDTDARGKPTTNLTVTLNKKLALDVSGGKSYDFKFLDYGSVEGVLNAVNIANNRFAFTENEVGQFMVEEKTKANKAVTRYDPQKVNAARAAGAFVDNAQALTSARQNAVAEGLNELSQIAGAENKFIEALDAANPDDNNMVTENTLSTITTAISAAKERTSSSVSMANKGLASGDMPSGITVWSKALHNRSKLDASAGYAGFKSKNNGIAMGADKMLSQNIKLGLGYAYTDGEIKNRSRRTDVDTHMAMLYAEYKPADWYVNGFMSYGWSDYKSKAYSVLGTTKSDFDVYAAQAQANLGYDIEVAEKTVLTPELGLSYVNITQDDYKDSDDKRIGKVHNDVVTASAGVKLKKSYEIANEATITPEAHLGVNYDIIRDNNGNVVKLSNGSSYVVDGRAMKRFAIEADFGFMAEFGDSWEFGAGYEGLFRKDYRDHSGILNCRYKF